MSKAKVYALYKGDENICDGTLQEIAEKTGKKLEYIRWLTYPTYKKRVQEPYNEAWDILKTIRDDNSDEAWDKFRSKLDQFYKRIDEVPNRGTDDYIKNEKEYLE